MELAKDTRAVVSPSPAQLRAFLAFVRHHRLATRARWPVPRFGALAAIAYRHLRSPDGPSATPAASVGR